ncbi:MAG: hypothetical protein HYY18_14525 [Planctomycetes bacterium]|nr:hypothetical protein [Planctomycetota bacterium]
MKRSAFLAALLALASCGGGSYAPPAADRAQVLVKLRAAPKEGIRGPKAEGTDAYSDSGGPERGKRFQRVDYRHLGDIAVVLSGAGLGEGGPAPKTASLELYSDGASRRLILMGPGGSTSLTIVNRRSSAVSLFCCGDTGDGFDARLGPGEQAAVTLSKPGTYEMVCDEDETLKATILVAPTSWAAQGESGDEVFFDNLPPGEYEVAVIAPRLPRWTRNVSAVAGKRETVEAEVSVNSMRTVK